MLRMSYILGLLFVIGLSAQPVFAQTPDEALAQLQKDAAESIPNFQGFSAARGEKFFKVKHGNEWSCTSCHTDNPAIKGKHAKTEKSIDPIAPSANAERFTNPKKVAKWFKRNCNDVLDRVCTPQEKGDVLAYLLTIRK
ncbi:MAG: DUF1924 domain-containing protein [Gallionella sp.]